jgi:hypothetical protein
MADKQLTNKQRYWLEHLQSWSQTSESLSSYAKRCGLKAQTLYTSKGRLVALGLWPAGEAPPQGPRFVRVNVPGGTRAPVSCQVHLPNGVRVDVPVGDAQLASVLRTAAAL